MKRNPVFSIIIPTCQAQDRIATTLESVRQQTFAPGNFEVIIVDDASTDDTADVVRNFIALQPTWMLHQQYHRSGPGVARNSGILFSTGDYLLFLDDDDTLKPEALATLYYRISCTLTPPELVAFNYAFTDDPPDHPGRRDDLLIVQNRHQRLSQYLQLRMDGSVIFTAFSRSLIRSLPPFRSGVHEDVDFLYYAYRQANAVGAIAKVLYRKTPRPGAITSTITTKHIDGFFDAWKAIGETLTKDQISDYRIGLTALIATRLREIVRKVHNEHDRNLLYEYLFQMIGRTLYKPDWTLSTPYGILARSFFQSMTLNVVTSITHMIETTLRKSWSCTDLHHSIYLAPSEVRTCCKRFFVGEELRGDVVLLGENSVINAENILDAKQRLYRRINTGQDNPCSGCPFMEFKEWQPLTLDIRTLSLEQDTHCSLKCAYCSETYYGGSNPHYDVDALIYKIWQASGMEHLSSVVYGGGEPTMRKDFGKQIEELVEAFPKARHHVLTNAGKINPTLLAMVKSGRASITTSVDAGTRGTFNQVRGKKLWNRVISGLSAYVDANAHQVTIKYIFTEGNSTEEEIEAFVALVEQQHWQASAFQISADFKTSQVDPVTLYAMVLLHGKLRESGVRAVFLDDHVLQHLGDTENLPVPSFLDRYLESPGTQDHPQRVWIWGAGRTAQHLIQRSRFFQIAVIAGIVDDTPSKIGTEFFGHCVLNPLAAIESTYPVILAATTHYPLIYQRAILAGLHPTRILRKVIL